jgi:hypothetical protein
MNSVISMHSARKAEIPCFSLPARFGRKNNIKSMNSKSFFFITKQLKTTV